MPKQGVYVLAEVTQDGKVAPLTLELMGLGGELASRLADRLYAVIVGSKLQEVAQELAGLGADEVSVLDDPGLSRYNPDIYLPLLKGLFTQKEPRAILVGHTSMGQDLAPRLAFALEAGLIGDCIGAEVEDGELHFVKPVYGGNVLATQRAVAGTVVATVRTRVGQTPSSQGGGTVILVESEIPGDVKVELRSRERTVPVACNLEEAPVVVAGGRGIGGKEDFKILHDLAHLFGGAVGASRPPVDSGWISTVSQVGITGKVVAPDLYIAVAISGSSQHLSGMSDSGKIVAVNKDPEAYIFSVSDYGVIGDWREVLPGFLERCRDLLKE